MDMDIAALLIQFTLWSESTIGAYGYPGIFLVSFLSAASVILPAPGFAAVFALGAVLNPWLVGIVAGVGAGLGEITSYMLGRGGHELAKRKYQHIIKRIKAWEARYSAFLVILAFNATPLPADVIGLFAGFAHYNVRKFLLAAIIGKVIMMLILAWAGFSSLEALKAWFAVG